MHLPRVMALAINCALTGISLTACRPEEPDLSTSGAVLNADNDLAAQQIAERVAEYLAAIQRADLATASEYWAENARLIGPGLDLDREGLLDGMKSVFDAGTRVEVLDRTTLELFVHGNSAYELAQAEEVFVSTDGAADTTRNNMFVRWERGADNEWRFSRAVLGPKGTAIP